MAPRRRAPFPSSSSSSSSVVTEERGEEEVWKPSTAKKTLKKKKTRAKKGAPVTAAALHAVVEAARIPWTKVEAAEMLKAAEVLVSEKKSEMTKVMRSFDQDINTLREILDLLRDGMRQSFDW
ncbi:hypothetical protein COCNU_08G008260 [Cocos nucifera]|uniref:Uncharacterized protein n=1 Tax=Cocos nucifera TaxID=13894 RepID=A0A8K0IIV0_COCNU|nr:hypothetical protein COCNU_08G008260 [Cocos nucifera]